VGTVFLVGAGPGDPELLTVRAVSLLGRADAVVYDRLVQTAALEHCRPDAERIYVGKVSGRHVVPQEKINALLAELAGRVPLVVRLKGGDPLVFGRGGEEAEYLAERGIAFEVVPGVSAALAAPAAAGIPITHRDMSCSFAVVTGHEKGGAPDGRIDWTALARIDTIVVLMGVRSLDHIAGRLMAAGRSSDTPAALVQNAYWPNERVVVGTLETIVSRAIEEGVEPPATLVVGSVVALHGQLRQSLDRATAFRRAFAAETLGAGVPDLKAGACAASPELKLDRDPELRARPGVH
jgi:uroporphyrin-III C-methyltransferase